MSMSHFCRAWWARWGLGSLAGGKRYHFSPGYTTNGKKYFVKMETSQTRPYNMQRLTFRHRAHYVSSFCFFHLNKVIFAV